MKKQILKTALSIAAFTVSLAAYGAPTIIITDGVATTGLIIGTNGVVQYVNGSFDASWSLVATAGATKPQIGSTGSPNMDISIQASAIGSAPVHDLSIVFSETDFGPTSGSFSALLNGHAIASSGGTVTFDTYFDPSNRVAAITAPLTASGALGGPTYFAFNQSGAITGAPFSLTEVVTISGTPASTYSLTANLQSLSLACAGGTGQIGTNYSSTLAASGGCAPYTYVVLSGALPPGLSLNPTNGAITGIPTQAGTFPYVAQVTDCAGRTADTTNQNCVITIGQCSGQIGDFVWNDLNGNGCQDAGEPGISNVKVDLYAGCGVAGTPVASTLTDASGHYLFSGLCPGTYTVSFNSPTGYTRTAANVGCVNSSLPPYRNQLDSKCGCAAGTPCGVCVTLTTANLLNLNVDCGYVCKGQVVIIPEYAKQDVITFSLTRYVQNSVSISNSLNAGTWSAPPTIYKTATSSLTTADVLKSIAIVLHRNAGYYPASAQLVLVQGELGGFFGYPYVSTLDDNSTTDGDNVRLATGRNMTNNPVNGALPPGHNQPWGQIFVKVYDSNGNATLCENVSFFFAIQVQECYDCFYLNSFITDTTFKFTAQQGPPCCAGSAATSGSGKDRYYMTLQFDNTLNNPYLNPWYGYYNGDYSYDLGWTAGFSGNWTNFYGWVGGTYPGYPHNTDGLYPNVVGLSERDDGVTPDGLAYVDSIKNNVNNPLDHHSYDVYTMRFSLKGIVTYSWNLKFVNKTDLYPDFVGTASLPVSGYGYVAKACSIFSGTVSFKEAIVASSKCCLDVPWDSSCGSAGRSYWFGIGDFDVQSDLATGDTGYIENYYNTAVPGYHLGDAVPVNTDLDLSFHPNFDRDYEPIKQALDNDYPQPGFEGTWMSAPGNPIVRDVQPPQNDGRPADGGQH